MGPQAGPLPSAAPQGLADGTCHQEDMGHVLSTSLRSPGSWRSETLGTAGLYAWVS